MLETNDSVTEVLAGSTHNFLEFAIRFGLNFLVIFILVRLIYYPIRKNRDFLFTFFLFNIINFLICYLLSSAQLKMGFAFGLFAIFSILRYRTVTVPVREMGYFFVSVTLGIINALTGTEDGFWLLAAANIIILAVAWVIDFGITITHENSKEIIYDRVDLLGAEKQNDLLEDLKKRTGLPVHRIEILKIDFLKDIVRMNVFYNAAKNESPSAAIGNDDED
jgi:hypothetical protein